MLENWLYLAANKPYGCRPVTVRTDKQHNAERFDLLDSIAECMIEHRIRGTDPMSFPACPSACGAFGGCDFVPICKITSKERMIASMNTIPKQGLSKPDFLKSIQALASGNKTAAEPEVETPVVQPPSTARKPWQRDPSVPSPEEAKAAVEAPAVPFRKPWEKNTTPSPRITPEPAVQGEQAFPEPVDVPNETAHTETIPAPAPEPSAEQPIVRKRVRRTKGNVSDMVVVEPGDANGIPDLELPAISEPVKTTVDNPKPIPPATDSSLLERLVVAMAGNSGYSGLPAVDIVTKAQAIVAALEIPQ